MIASILNYARELHRQTNKAIDDAIVDHLRSLGETPTPELVSQHARAYTLPSGMSVYTWRGNPFLTVRYNKGSSMGSVSIEINRLHGEPVKLSDIAKEELDKLNAEQKHPSSI